MANIIKITRFYGKDGLMTDKYVVEYDAPVTRNCKTWKTFTIKGEMCKKHFDYIMNATSRTEYKKDIKYREIYELEPTTEETEILDKEEFEQRIGMTYDELETAISKNDCSFRGELAHDEKCELKQPVELYVDTRAPYLLNIKHILDNLFMTIGKFKSCYFWCEDYGNRTLREHTNDYYSIKEHSFEYNGIKYTFEYNVDYHRRYVTAYGYYTKDGKKTTLKALKTVYAKICKELNCENEWS